MTALHPELSTLKTRAKEKLRRDIGMVIETALHDPRTVEIMVNADGQIWQERLGEAMQCIGSLAPGRAEAVIKTIAGFHEKEITRATPMLEGEFPLDGSRFAGQLPPIVPAPTFAIRKKAVAIFTLQQYVDAGILTRAHYQIIRDAIVAHRNILVIGGTGSGKTTLVNAIIHDMVRANPTERLVIIEDTGEIQCAAANCVQYHTTLDVTMTMLLKTTLRMRPDRILVGEVRGAEALDLLDAWNTGHEGGIATLHANHPMAGLSRLKSLITRHPAAPTAIEPLIGDVVHLIIHIARTATGRRVQALVSVTGFDGQQYLTHHHEGAMP